MAKPKTVLFAGGGSGGHIYPNVAVWEHLRDAGMQGHFLVSERPLDAQITAGLGLDYSAIPAAPLIARPKGLLKFLKGFRAARRATRQVIQQTDAKALVATGGFVSAPAAAAAADAGLPVALVSLDAVPGKANRLAARWATQVFSVYDTPVWPSATRVGLPLRREAVPGVGPAEARAALGLDADKPVLVVVAGSQGLGSINQMMVAFAKREAGRRALQGWQVLHLSGTRDEAMVRAGYAEARVGATVWPFCDRMGLAWAASDLAVSLAGAGSAAEVWANAVPTVFFPYPYHKDQHQKLNAEPLVATGGALLREDVVDAQRNADTLEAVLPGLLEDAAERSRMRGALRQHAPANGAETLGRFLIANL